jgi:hypothetical protein
MFMYDVDMQVQWLISGAVDLIKVNAHHRMTAAMKLAHLAGLHGVSGLWA